MNREIQDIKVTEKEDGCLKRTTYEHPAFGVARFLRTSGSPEILFGSELEHSTCITLEICKAKEERTLSNDYHYPKDKIVQIEMSQAQFTELITSFGKGSGVPCTIRYTEKDGVLPDIPAKQLKDEKFKKEFETHLEDAHKQLNQIRENIQDSLDNKKNLTVNDRKALLSKLQQIEYNIGCNLNFVASQYDEYMSTVKTAAKSEIEVYYIERIKENNNVKKIELK